MVCATLVRKASHSVLAYLRALVNCSRDLLVELPDQPPRRLPLARLYVPRTVTPIADPRLAMAPPVSRPALDVVAAAQSRLTLVGAAGTGKRLLVHWLVLLCALGQGGVLEGLADLQPVWPGDAPIPILIAREHIAALLLKGQRAFADFTLQRALEQQLEQLGLAAQWPMLQQALARGGCLVLVQGNDARMSAAARRVFRAALAQFIAEYPHNRFVVTCRSHAQGPPGLGFAACTLDMLDEAQRDRMIAGWVAALSTHPAASAPQVDRVQALMRYDPALREIAAHPLALAIALVADSLDMPTQAHHAAVGASLTAWLRNGAAPAPGALVGPPRITFTPALTDREKRPLARLLPLAYALHARQSGSAQASLTRSETVALCREGDKADPALSPQASARLVDEYIRQGLLVPVTAGRAYHLPFPFLQRYLAAEQLAQSPDFIARAYQCRAQAHWRAVLALAVQRACVYRPEACAELLALLLASPADQVLAAQCLAQVGDTFPPQTHLRARAQAHLLALTQAASAPLPTRVEAGLLLGQLGHPALAGALPALLPVEGGLFLFGERESGYPDEGPQRMVDVPPFAIGVSPVTNHEYARFMAAQPSAPVPRYWHDPRFNNPAQPVVGVTWDEASAYAAWLNTELDRHGLLPGGSVFRLPQEVEWEKAASWDAQQRVKRRYPWGAGWAADRANIAEERGAWVTTPVGCYPLGVSAYGVHDMIGNVWEWMADEYASYPGAATTFAEPESRVLRGSSCVSHTKHARCTYRGRLRREHWRFHLGFRLVLARPLK